MRVTFLLLVLALGAAALEANAPPPEDDWIYSPNKQYVLRLTFRGNDQNVYKADDREKPLWSFRIEQWGHNFHVADDGSVVAEVRDSYYDLADKSKAGVLFRDKTGIVAEHSYESLCAQPRPTSYQNARQWHYQDYREGKFLYVRAVDGTLSRFEFATGKLVEQSKTESAPESCGSRCSTAELAFGAGAALSALALLVLGLRLRRGRPA